jgi:hypothetical protein
MGKVVGSIGKVGMDVLPSVQGWVPLLAASLLCLSGRTGSLGEAMLLLLSGLMRSLGNWLMVLRRMLGSIDDELGSLLLILQLLSEIMDSLGDALEALP